jgi:hypothetical protein
MNARIPGIFREGRIHVRKIQIVWDPSPTKVQCEREEILAYPVANSDTGAVWLCVFLGNLPQALGVTVG